MTNRERLKGKKIYIAIGIFGLIFIISLIYILDYYSDLRNARRAYEEVKEEVVAVSEPEPTPVPQEPYSEPELVPEPPFVSKIDFAGLQERNSDAYAWIEIPGTVIDYPILQHLTDDTYYLDHTFEKVAGLPGSIYTESFNQMDFSDFDTILYGHNMKNGSMFKGLHQYENADFWAENPYINIYLPDRDLKYEIWAVGVVSDEHILHKYNDFADDADKERFIRSMSGATRGSELEVTKDSKLITLATCIGGRPNNRLWVTGVLVEGEIGNEEILDGEPAATDIESSISGN